MRDNVTISYRGASHELGQGPRYYGIWAIGALRAEPLERWPDTADGWAAASARFTEIEPQGAIIAVTQARPRRVSTRSAVVVATALLGLGVAAGIAGLFPVYLGQSLASQASELVPHLIYLAAWTASAVLIVLGGSRQGVGALIGLGTSVVTFGLFVADAGYAIAGGAGAPGAGLGLSLVGWAACAVGSVLAIRIRPAGAVAGPGRPGRLQDGRSGDGHRVAALVATVAAGIGAAIAFAPSWDRFTLRAPAAVLRSVTSGNAFATPGPVIAGEVAVMVAVVVAVAMAALWRPVRLGAALLAGAIIPLAAQAISAMIQIGQPVSPGQLGVSPAIAARLGITISTSLTLAFWVFGAFVIALALSCAQMTLTPDTVTPAPADLPGSSAQDLPDATTTSLSRAGSDRIGSVTGSLYMVPVGTHAEASPTDPRD